MDFEAAFKLILLVAAAVAIPVAAYAAVVATRAIWVKVSPARWGATPRPGRSSRHCGCG